MTDRTDILKIIFYSLPDKEREFICGSTEYGLEFNPETDKQFGIEDHCVAQIRMGKNRSAYWLTIITHPRARRIGCATFIFNLVKQYIKKQGNPWPVALCSKIHKDNIVSQKWHKAMGFEKIKEEGNQYIYSIHI